MPDEISNSDPLSQQPANPDWIEAAFVNIEQNPQIIDPYDLYPIEDKTRLDAESVRLFYSTVYSLYPTGQIKAIGVSYSTESIQNMVNHFNRLKETQTNSTVVPNENDLEVEEFLYTHPIAPYAMFLPTEEADTFVLRTINNGLALMRFDRAVLPKEIPVPNPSIIWALMNKPAGAIGYLDILNQSLLYNYSEKDGVKVYLNSTNSQITEKQLRRLVSCYKSAVIRAIEQAPQRAINANYIKNQLSY